MFPGYYTKVRLKNDAGAWSKLRGNGLSPTLCRVDVDVIVLHFQSVWEYLNGNNYFEKSENVLGKKSS